MGYTGGLNFDRLVCRRKGDHEVCRPITSDPNYRCTYTGTSCIVIRGVFQLILKLKKKIYNKYKKLDILFFLFFF